MGLDLDMGALQARAGVKNSHEDKEPRRKHLLF